MSGVLVIYSDKHKEKEHFLTMAKHEQPAFLQSMRGIDSFDYYFVSVIGRFQKTYLRFERNFKCIVTNQPSSYLAAVWLSFFIRYNRALLVTSPAADPEKEFFSTRKKYGQTLKEYFFHNWVRVNKPLFLGLLTNHGGTGDPIHLVVHSIFSKNGKIKAPGHCQEVEWDQSNDTICLQCVIPLLGLYNSIQNN